MLYIDQPVQVGFSYDSLANYTTNLITGDTTRLNPSDPIPEQNATFLVGTYPSDNLKTTAKGTRNAAIALWHFAQVWFQEFPGYHPNDSRISISTESYGGRYGPGFTSFFEEQNEKILNGTWNGTQGEQFVLDLDTLLIINGCIDWQVQLPTFPLMAANNTYGLKTVDDSVYQEMIEAYSTPGGCRDQISDCRAAASIYDPENTGIHSTVNALCRNAGTFCSYAISRPWAVNSGRSVYDIGQLNPDPFPLPFHQGWLNQPHVQAALGVPLNFTTGSYAPNDAFGEIGDSLRAGLLEDLAYVLERGIKVALVYGDRDFICNWMGGEAVSLAINHTHAAAFRAAGYAKIQANGSYDYVGGLVRQHGNLSYSRVFEAGHEVPAYQPETAYAIFRRALFNRDIATGTVDVLAGGTDRGL